jgi:hypothetical protein
MSAKVSSEELKNIEEEIKEIESGEYVTLKELKRDLETGNAADNKDSQYRSKKHKSTRS